MEDVWADSQNMMQNGGVQAAEAMAVLRRRGVTQGWHNLGRLPGGRTGVVSICQA